MAGKLIGSYVVGRMYCMSGMWELDWERWYSMTRDGSIEVAVRLWMKICNCIGDGISVTKCQRVDGHSN